jgi:hypothetical protein
MNYRRGLQRVYAIVTVAWIAVVFIGVFSGRWEPWVDWSNWANRGWYFVSEVPTFTASIDDIDVPGTERLRVHLRWGWSIGLASLPPLALYFILFFAIPWAYRGFRPATQ